MAASRSRSTSSAESACRASSAATSAGDAPALDAALPGREDAALPGREETRRRRIGAVRGRSCRSSLTQSSFAGELGPSPGLRVRSSGLSVPADSGRRRTWPVRCIVALDGRLKERVDDVDAEDEEALGGRDDMAAWC